MKAIINGIEYIIVAKVLYASSANGHKYWKAFLQDKSVIGLDASDENTIVYFGKLIEPLPYDYDNLPGELVYKEKVFRKDGGSDYERVVKMEFGELKDSEGECKFANYVAEDGSWLSPAVISETGARADYYGENIEKYEIKID
jgi:hypothetical protein